VIKENFKNNLIFGKRVVVRNKGNCFANRCNSSEKQKGNLKKKI